MLNEQNPPPWYKQFWPWFLLTVPVVSVVLGITMLFFASTTKDSLVKDDYYKEGKAINVNRGKIEKAKQLGISTLLTMTDERAILRFTSGEPEDKAALILEFFHPTLSTNDFTLLLSRNGEGLYQADLDQPIIGKWQVTLLPFHKEWRIQQTFTFPRFEPVIFKP